MDTCGTISTAKWFSKNVQIYTHVVIYKIMLTARIQQAENPKAFLWANSFWIPTLSSEKAFIFTSSSFSSKDLSRCWGMTSLKPFCRARNWASMPCRKRQFTYNLQEKRKHENTPMPTHWKYQILRIWCITSHTWRTPSWCPPTPKSSCHLVWARVGWFPRKHCAQHRKYDPGHQWCHYPWRGGRKDKDITFSSVLSFASRNLEQEYFFLIIK